MPSQWKIILDGYPDAEGGHVASRDGEILGTWALVAGVFYKFTPEGADEHLFFEAFLNILCQKISDWHEGHGSA